MNSIKASLILFFVISFNNANCFFENKTVSFHIPLNQNVKQQSIIKLISDELYQDLKFNWESKPSELNDDYIFQFFNKFETELSLVCQNKSHFKQCTKQIGIKTIKNLFNQRKISFVLYKY